MDQNDIKSLPRNDQVILGAGALAFITSFFPYYGLSVTGFGSYTVNSWHSYATLAVLLMLAATAVAAAQVFAGASLPKLEVSWTMIVVGLSGLATLLYVLRSFTLKTASAGGASLGLKWGAYVTMILLIVQLVFAVMKLRASGEAMPWQGGSPAPPAA
jgi:hypothetical protein